MAVLVILAWLVETVIAAVIRAEDLRARYSVTLADELGVQWRLGLAVGVSAIITVFGADGDGPGELAVFAGPLLVIQFAFRRYAGIRATYLQTVRALAQVTEVAGYVESGHSRRVSQDRARDGPRAGHDRDGPARTSSTRRSCTTSASSRWSNRSRAARPSGVSATTAQRIAGLGSEVISKTGVLDDVAEIVRCQWLPYRGGQDQAADRSRVIRVANAFDDLVGGSSDRDRIAAVLSGLRADTAREYDPTWSRRSPGVDRTQAAMQLSALGV